MYLHKIVQLRFMIFFSLILPLSLISFSCSFHFYHLPGPTFSHIYFLLHAHNLVISRLRFFFFINLFPNITSHFISSSMSISFLSFKYLICFFPLLPTIPYLIHVERLYYLFFFIKASLSSGVFHLLKSFSYIFTQFKYKINSEKQTTDNPTLHFPHHLKTPAVRLRHQLAQSTIIRNLSHAKVCHTTYKCHPFCHLLSEWPSIRVPTWCSAF